MSTESQNNKIKGSGDNNSINNNDLELGVSRDANGKATDIGFGTNSGYVHPEPIGFGKSVKVFHKPLLGLCAQKCSKVIHCQRRYETIPAYSIQCIAHRYMQASNPVCSIS